ncbi:MAG TPA: PRC-barrel domain-containing protein [Stellaceae bacterium]|nr:PRC-barrel domain-containing protein [Stellaceae bacterium]
MVLVLPGVATFAERCHAAVVVVAESQPGAPPAPAPAAAPPSAAAPPAPSLTAPTEDQPKTGAKMPENVKPLPSSEAAAVLGKKVRGANGEELGPIVDVLVDSDGHPLAAVIDFGGFLGVGSRKVAVDWKALDFTSLGRADTVGLGLNRAQIAAAPEYKPGPPGANVVTTPSSPLPPVDAHK